MAPTELPLLELLGEKNISGQARRLMARRHRIRICFPGNYFPATVSGPKDTASGGPRLAALPAAGHLFLYSDVFSETGEILMGRQRVPRDFQVLAHGERSSGVTHTITASIRPNGDCSLLGVTGICKLIKTGDLAAEIEFLR